MTSGQGMRQAGEHALCEFILSRGHLCPLLSTSACIFIRVCLPLPSKCWRIPESLLKWLSSDENELLKFKCNAPITRSDRPSATASRPLPQPPPQEALLEAPAVEDLGVIPGEQETMLRFERDCERMSEYQFVSISTLQFNASG